MKGQLLKKWFITYLIIISISLGFIFIIYKIYTDSMKKDINQLNYTYLNQLITLVDSKILSVKQTVNILSLHPNTLSTINLDKEQDAYDLLTIAETTENLQIHTIANDIIKNIDIYAHKPEMLITVESLYRDKFLNLYTEKNFEMDKETFKNIIKKSYDKGVILRLSQLYNKELKNPNDPLLFIQSIPQYFHFTKNATIIVELNEEIIDGMINSPHFNSDDSVIYILDNQNRTLFSSDKSEFPENIKSLSFERDSFAEYELNNQHYVVYHGYSPQNDWNYYRIITLDSHFRSINEINDVVVTTIILLIIVSIVLAYYFSYASYKPVKSIIKNIDDPLEHKVKSEYEYILNAIQYNKTYRKKMEKIISSQSKTVLDSFLIKIITNHINDEASIHETLESYDLIFNQPMFSMVLIEFIDLETENYDRNLVSFIIQNVFSEILSKDYTYHILEIENRVACIINYNSNKHDNHMFESSLLYGYNLITKTFNIQLHIGLSQEHEGILSLPILYKESYESASYSKMLGDDQIIKYEYTQQLKRQYSFSFELENKLLNNIKLGKYNEALQIIKTVISVNTANKHLRIESIQCLMFDILSVIVKSASSRTQQNILEEEMPISRMMASKTLESMENVIVSTLEKMCNYNKEFIENECQNKITEKVTEYVLTNYMNPDMNISHLSDIFDMTPAYLSKIYKRDTGEALADVINKTRINHAIELLLTTSYTVNEISSKVGYLYSNAFIRFFKKQTGVTPGKYRSLYTNTSSN